MLDDETHFLLMRAFNSSNHAAVARTSSLGLQPGQPKILEYLSEHDGSRAKDISDGCVLDKSTMTSLLSRMESDGLVERRRSETDGRAMTVWLTERGTQVAAQVRQAMSEVDTIAASTMDDADRSKLNELLRQVIEGFDQADDEFARK